MKCLMKRDTQLVLERVLQKVLVLLIDLGILVLNPFALSCHFGSKIEEELISRGESEEASQKNNAGTSIKLVWKRRPFNSKHSDEVGSLDLQYGTERNHQNFLKL